MTPDPDAVSVIADALRDNPTDLDLVGWWHTSPGTIAEALQDAGLLVAPGEVPVPIDALSTWLACSYVTWARSKVGNSRRVLLDRLAARLDSAPSEPTPPSPQVTTSAMSPTHPVTITLKKPPHLPIHQVTAATRQPTRKDHLMRATPEHTSQRDQRLPHAVRAFLALTVAIGGPLTALAPAALSSHAAGHANVQPAHLVRAGTSWAHVNGKALPKM
jgi:hypothetical protein